MRFVPIFLMVLVAAVAVGCTSKFKRYYGPEVTRIIVQKEARRMYLLHHGEVLEAYDIDLGFAPVGDKQIEGDGKTPKVNTSSTGATRTVNFTCRWESHTRTRTTSPKPKTGQEPRWRYLYPRTPAAVPQGRPGLDMGLHRRGQTARSSRFTPWSRTARRS